MTKDAIRTIILCTAILHLLLVLPFSAGSVTCIDGDGLIKIETNCEPICLYEEGVPVATGAASFDRHEQHDHGDASDCTHFLLSTFMRVATTTHKFSTDRVSADLNAFEVVRHDSGPDNLNLQGAGKYAKTPPLLAQMISSLETTVVIC